MRLLFYIILLCLFLLIISEPLYIRVEKSKDTSLAFHFVFFALYLKMESGKGSPANKSERKKISLKSYVRAWLKLRKRVKIKLDAVYFPVLTSPYTQALLCGLFPAFLEGERAYSHFDDTSFALHIETTLPDCLILYLKALLNERKKEKVW